MLTVIATIRSKNGAEEKVRQRLVGLVAPTRTENGCVDYILYHDQSDPSTLIPEPRRKQAYYCRGLGSL